MMREQNRTEGGSEEGIQTTQTSTRCSTLYTVQYTGTVGRSTRMVIQSNLRLMYLTLAIYLRLTILLLLTKSHFTT